MQTRRWESRTSKKALDDLLVSLDVQLHAFAVCEVELDARLTFDPANLVIIHYVLEGSGYVEVAGGRTSLAAGAMAIVPAGCSQTLIVDPDARRVVPAGEHCSMLVDGLLRFDAAQGRQGALRTICTTVAATLEGSFGLFDKLSVPLVENLTRLPLVASAFSLLLAERSHPDVGTHALSEALMKQCLILLIRDHINRQRGESLLFSALTDPRLTRAVALVLQRPGGQLTVDDLASAANMSRSSFAKAFAAAYDQTPMEFVQRARLQNAARLLSTTDLPVKLIAGSTGFASRSHFSRAFRNAYGADPSAFRRAHIQDAQSPPRNSGATWADKLLGDVDPGL